LVEAVSDLTTTELIGTANIFFFVLVISTVAVIPGLKGEYVVGLPTNKSSYDSFNILILTLKFVT
jgi:hypothetical protein